MDEDESKKNIRQCHNLGRSETIERTKRKLDSLSRSTSSSHPPLSSSRPSTVSPQPVLHLLKRLTKVANSDQLLLNHLGENIDLFFLAAINSS